MLSVTKQLFITDTHFKAIPDYCSLTSIRLLSLGYGAESVSDAEQQAESMELPPSSA